MNRTSQLAVPVVLVTTAGMAPQALAPLLDGSIA
jgi:hypothetical protein